MEHLSVSLPSKIVPRGTIILFLIISIVFFAFQVDWGTYLQQSILERKNQYLSIPTQEVGEWLTGKGLGSYVSVLAEKSPGLFYWELQPIHNTYILALFEVGMLPIIGPALYLFFRYKKKWEKWAKFSSLQLFSGACAVVVLVLLGGDHYFWDLEQGQFTLIFLLTLFLFSFSPAFSKEEKGV